MTPVAPIRLALLIAVVATVAPTAARAEGFRATTLDGSPDLAAVWAAGEEIWVAAPAGTVHHRRKGAWTAAKMPASGDVTDVAGAGPRDVWAVGVAGLMARWNGKAWASVPSESTAGFAALVVTGARAGAAVAGDRILTWDGERWTAIHGRLKYPGLAAIAPLGGKPARWLAVGAKGLAILVTGTGPEARGVAETTGVSGDLAAVAACPGAKGEAVAVGTVAARRDASGRWAELPAPPAAARGAVLRCRGARAERLYTLAGSELLVLDVAKGQWTRRTVAPGADLTDLAAFGARGLVVVGRRGLVAVAERLD